MSGYTGLTPDFIQKFGLVSTDDTEMTFTERQVVYIFNTKEELLTKSDMVGELAIALDIPDSILLVTSYDGTCEFKAFRKLRKPLQIMSEEENQNGGD